MTVHIPQVELQLLSNVRHSKFRWHARPPRFRKVLIILGSCVPLDFSLPALWERGRPRSSHGRTSPSACAYRLQRLWRCTGGTRAGAGSCCVEQSARLFVVATSPSHRTSWHTRASTRTIVGMSTERWCPLNMVWLNRRSAAHRVLRRPAASSQLSPEQSASSPRSTTGPPRHAPRWWFRGRSTADRRSAALLKPAATAGAGRVGAPHLQREGSASRVVWSLQPAGPPSRGLAERYAERPDAEEVHPEDDPDGRVRWPGRGGAAGDTTATSAAPPLCDAF